MDIYTNNKDMWKLEKKSRSKPYNNYNYNTKKINYLFQQSQNKDINHICGYSKLIYLI